MWKKSEVTLVPIYGLHPEHFALLVLRKKGEKGDEVKVNYYDPLQKLHQHCKSNAEVLLEILDIDHEIQHQANVSRQKETECGWFVSHWLEEEMRAYSGQGRGTQGWPGSARLKKVSEHLIKCATSLEAFRQSWVKLQIEEGRKGKLRK